LRWGYGDTPQNIEFGLSNSGDMISMEVPQNWGAHGSANWDGVYAWALRFLGYHPEFDRTWSNGVSVWVEICDPRENLGPRVSFLCSICRLSDLTRINRVHEFLLSSNHLVSWRYKMVGTLIETHVLMTMQIPSSTVSNIARIYQPKIANFSKTTFISGPRLLGSPWNLCNVERVRTMAAIWPRKIS